MNKLLALVLVIVASLTIAPNANALTCSELDGSVVYSQESSPQYLGFFGTSSASESIMWSAGQYGSTWGTYSVRNTSGQYGSTWGTYSANTSWTSTPPKIYKYGSLIAYLTTNTAITSGVSLADIDASCTFYSSVPSTGSPPPPPLP